MQPSRLRSRSESVSGIYYSRYHWHILIINNRFVDGELVRQASLHHASCIMTPGGPKLGCSGRCGPYANRAASEGGSC